MADEIRILRGEPSEEELAAVVAVLLARRFAPGNDAGRSHTPVSRWARSARPRAVPLLPGGQAWRTSSLPR